MSQGHHSSSNEDQATVARQAEFLELLAPVYPKALAYAQAISGSLIDGEDLTSDAVLKAYSRFHQLRSRDKFREWFFSILLNGFRNQRNRDRLRRISLVAEPAGAYSFWEATKLVSNDPAELGYQLTLTRELLGRLNPRERETLLLLGPGDLSPDEVAAIHRISSRAVIQCAYRARKKLAAMVPEGALPFSHGTVVQETTNE
ncbi:MAG: RNA polymerase sigma factor [Planctomycetales bacterium]|nr:RNA polymerase sigma factor [bacterium]UNM09989.1 MAG: RNA polymerase sigma factor [Planctomycetales bacterium]